MKEFIESLEKNGTYKNLNRHYPLVTVITPAYNREFYIREVIESILTQDYPNLEYIIIDDGSTDKTAEVISGAIEEFGSGRRIRFESHANMGETRTVNKGLRMAGGDIIGIVNSDDPLLPGAISAIISRFVEREDLSVVYPDWNYIDKEGKAWGNVVTMDYDFTDMVRLFKCVPGPGAFFRKSVAESLGGRDTDFRYVGDFDFWLRAGLLGPFERMPKTLATFRVHPDSASVSQKGTLMSEEHLRLLRKLYSLPQLPDEVKKWRIRLQSYSSAYFIAGATCGSDQSIRRAFYYLTSMFYCPLKYTGEFSWRFSMILPALFGPLYKPLKPFFIRIYWLLKKFQK